jgi:hypothetical protein
MSAPTPPLPTPSTRDPNAPAVAPAKKKFQNGWTREIEKLMAEWADKAICYRWMHEKTERIYKSKDYAYMFPVIILSTVTGAANFALDSYITSPDDKKNAQLALGTLSIVTGIISTIANRLGYASGSEAHKGAAVMWGKFQRLIAIELSLHPNERTDCMHFLKTCRTELDRLIEQSPTIPDDVIQACKKEFAHYPKVRKPEIVGDIDTTSIFVDTNSRLREIAKDAAITIQQKKGILKQIVLDDLEPRINRVIENSTLPSIREELKKDIQKAAEKATRDAIAAVHMGRVTALSATGIPAKIDISTGGVSLVERSTTERANEVKSLAMSGVVSEMRQKLASANKATGPAPKGVGALFAGLTSVVGSTDDIVLHVKDVTSPLPNMPEGEQSDYDDEESDGDEEEGDTTEKK